MNLSVCPQGVAYTLEGSVRNPLVATWPRALTWRMESYTSHWDVTDWGPLKDGIGKWENHGKSLGKP